MRIEKQQNCIFIPKVWISPQLVMNVSCFAPVVHFSATVWDLLVGNSRNSAYFTQSTLACQLKEVWLDQETQTVKLHKYAEWKGTNGKEFSNVSCWWLPHNNIKSHHHLLLINYNAGFIEMFFSPLVWRRWVVRKTQLGGCMSWLAHN